MIDERLIFLNKVMHRIPLEERRFLVEELKNLDSKNLNDDPLSYKKTNLVLEIYRGFYQRPATVPLFSSLMTEQEVKEQLFCNKIMSGLNAYMQYSDEEKKAFQEKLLNPLLPKKLLSRTQRVSQKYVLDPVLVFLKKILLMD